MQPWAASRSFLTQPSFSGDSILVQEGVAVVAVGGSSRMVSGRDEGLVRAKQGRLRVEGNGPATDVVQGKTLTVPPKTARDAPKSSPVLNAPGAGCNMALQVGSQGSSGLSAVLSGVAISRANRAKDAATAANQAASQADTDAKAATAAANAVTAAANGASSDANNVGGALNEVATSLGATVSPYTPPSGFPPC